MTPEELEEAVQFAKYIIWWRINDFEEYLLKPEFALYWCNRQPIHRQALISIAMDGWDGPHILLYEMARFLTEIGDPLPLWLQRYVVFAARTGGTRRSKKGRDPMANLTRDMAIEQAIDWVSDRFGLNPTRNPANSRGMRKFDRCNGA